MWLNWEAFHAFFVPCVSDILTGFGLTALLQFSGVSPDLDNFLLVGFGGVLAAVLLNSLAPCQPLPPWVQMCNSTFSLLVSLSVCLNLLSQLCPPTGKELSLIPVYVILCIPRVAPSSLALVLQCFLTLILASAFLLLPTSSSVRSNDTGPMDVGTAVALFEAVFFACAWNTFDATEHSVYPHHKSGMLMRIFGGLIKGALLMWLASTSNTSLYHFMFERPNTVPHELFVGYGILLVFACMQTAARWFGQLRQILNRATCRAVIRMQHIIYALVVGAAWAFPLQLGMLRVIIVTALVSVNLVYCVAKQSASLHRF